MKLLKVPETLLGTYTIKAGTKIICDKAFYSCKALSSIVIPKSVINIGNSAFGECMNLTHIVIPKGVVKISDEGV